jgi:hypothetical protein
MNESSFPIRSDFEGEGELIVRRPVIGCSASASANLLSCAAVAVALVHVS